jgi:hypothetical protein
MARTRRLLGTLGLTCAWVLTACAAGGKAWVQEPESGFTAADPPQAQSAALLELASAPAPASPSELARTDADAPRRRLDHVVSLGDGAAAGPATGRDDAAASPYGAPAVVNVYNVLQPSTLGYGYGYASYGYAARGWASRPSTLPSTPSQPSHAPSTPSLGGDWSQTPSYGPSFPYRTAPASPWQRSH